ncbi:UrcA family protein [Phenylobacterium sp.]|uniref:UrcA family protein n=1 Tax=Phenylobacterium sp. TaxID=1871053 RepID=UPI00286D20C3|nr:UrcA family protein [Phenylobacterium sp.]
MTRFSLLAALAASTLLSAGAVRAETDIMVIRLGDLNTASAQGAQVAFRRIHAGAARFCRDGDSRDLGRIAYQRACESRMIGKAVDQLAAPGVTALYRAQPNILLASRDPR